VQDFLPHLAYLFLHFAGDMPVKAVTGRLENRSKNPRVGFDHMDALIDAGPVWGRMRIASDIIPDSFRLIVRGTNGSAEADFYNPYVRFEGGRNVGKRAVLELMSSGFGFIRSGVINFRDKVVQHGTYHGMPRMLDAIYAGISDGKASPIKPQHIRRSARLVDQLVQLGK
jgi:predicted dehydrogenase